MPAPTDWLLETDNPSVRYFTLRDILGKHEGSRELQETKLEKKPRYKYCSQNWMAEVWFSPDVPDRCTGDTGDFDTTGL